MLENYCSCVNAPFFTENCQKTLLLWAAGAAIAHWRP